MSHLYDQSPVGKGFNGDLFGRVKVSQPYTIFDSTHRYTQDGDFDDVVLGTGSTVGFITAQSTATLSIGTTAGCSIVRESRRVFSYQPGKALQVLQTFVLNPPKPNLTQRVGYGGSENGVFLEQATNSAGITTIYWMMRTAKSGVTTEIRVPQSQWSIDKFDGTGVTGHTLDLTKAQLMFTEYEWLGVGAVRCGFAHEEGNFHIAHRFEHANIIDSVYMTTATLPVRYEILNTGITTSSSTMKQICVSVQSNGGYEKKQAECVVRRNSAVIGVGNSYVPIISIKLAPGKEDSVVIPTQFQVLPFTNNANYEIVILRNATLSGAGFSASPSPNVYYDTSATSSTGGEVVDIRYTVGSNQSSGAFAAKEDYNWDLQLGRTQSKASDIYTLAARTVTGQVGDIIGSLGFYDLT